MIDSRVPVPVPTNEPIKNYATGSIERRSLEVVLNTQLQSEIEIPLRIGGRNVETGVLSDVRAPHDHSHVLGRYHNADATHAEQAIVAAREAWHDWSSTPWEARAAVFLKAAELLAGPYRDVVNAATMHGQSKTVFQAEIDAACELIDFFRFNVQYMQQIYAVQPESSPGIWNYQEYRPLEGFVFAVTPFNFTSIAANLPTAPALMGNTVVWKPSERSMYSAHFIMELLEAAGLPPGVINMVTGETPKAVGDVLLNSPELAGIHFTGSTRTFQMMWRHVGANIENYRSYPRVVGETGGKDFVFAHPSADTGGLSTALLRGAFEYQGQKCSAASRAYIPASIWDETIERLTADVAQIRMGSPMDFSNFMCAVIDQRAFASISSYIELAKDSNDHEIIAGGGHDDSEGYFIEPTVIVASEPDSRLMIEEIFGPVLTLYKYEDDRLDETLALCDTATAYGLTGGIFCRDRAEIVRLSRRLRNAAGNFYINDKPTGAVVGQQPFGGGRASGTNDKAGSLWNLIRWASPRSIKETFVPPTDFRYPHMD